MLVSFFILLVPLEMSQVLDRKAHGLTLRLGSCLMPTMPRVILVFLPSREQAFYYVYDCRLIRPDMDSRIWSCLKHVCATLNFGLLWFRERLQEN